MTERNLTLLAGEKIVDSQGKAALALMKRWQELVRRLEDHEARIAALEP